MTTTTTPLPKIARCPYCRLAGRKAKRGELSGTPTKGFVLCRQEWCEVTGPFAPSPADAIAQWNAVARAVKRGAKRGAAWRTEVEAAIYEVASKARVWGTQQTPVRDAVAAAMAIIDGDKRERAGGCPVTYEAVAAFHQVKLGAYHRFIVTEDQRFWSRSINGGKL